MWRYDALYSSNLQVTDLWDSVSKQVPLLGSWWVTNIEYLFIWLYCVPSWPCRYCGMRGRRIDLVVIGQHIMLTFKFNIKNRVPWRLDNLDDDEGVKDQDREVRDELREDQLAPDQVVWHVNRILPHLGAHDDGVVRVWVDNGRDLEELWDVVGDSEHDRAGDEPFDEEINILCWQKRIS